MSLPLLLQRYCKRYWIRSLECSRLCCLILCLRQRRLELPVEMIARFFYEGRLIGVVWSCAPGLLHEIYAAVLEFFYAASNSCILRFYPVLPDYPEVKPCLAAWSPDAEYVVALFDVFALWHSNSFRRTGNKSYRLFLVLFSVEFQKPVHLFVLKWSSSSPHHASNSENHYDVSISASPWRIACSVKGKLLMFKIQRNKLKLIWHWKDRCIPHVSFMQNGNVAYVCLQVGEVCSTQLGIAHTETGTELRRVTLPNIHGKVLHLTGILDLPRYNGSSVALALQRFVTDDLSKTCSNMQSIYHIDLRSGETDIVVFEFARVILGKTHAQNIYCDYRTFCVGTDWGEFHMVSDHSHSIYSPQKRSWIRKESACCTPPKIGTSFFLVTHVVDPIPFQHRIQTCGIMAWSPA